MGEGWSLKKTTEKCMGVLPIYSLCGVSAEEKICYAACAQMPTHIGLRMSTNKQRGGGRGLKGDKWGGGRVQRWGGGAINRKHPISIQFPIPHLQEVTNPCVFIHKQVTNYLLFIVLLKSVKNTVLFST
jgi:hypothetical protein